MSTIQPRPRCVLIGDSTGDNRLSVAVAAQLVERGAAAVVVAGRDQGDARAIREAVLRNAGRDNPDRAEIQATARRSPAVVVVVPLAGVSEFERLLEREPVALHSAHCLLALAHDAEQNLRVAVVARRVAGDVPVVLRSFDPEFADELERERPDKDRYVERAYSVAHLSAPSFVAAVLFGRARDHVLTMRVGTEYVSVWEVEVPAAGDPLPGARRRRAGGLLGRSPDDILQPRRLPGAGAPRRGRVVEARRRGLPDDAVASGREDPPRRATGRRPGPGAQPSGPALAPRRRAARAYDRHRRGPTATRGGSPPAGRARTGACERSPAGASGWPARP